MTAPVDASMTVTIGGVVTECESFHCDFVRNAPATGTLTLGLPLPAQVTDLASCVVTFTIGASTLTVFTGYVLVPSTAYGADGPSATLPLIGRLTKCQLPLNADIAFTGGARVAAITLPLGGDTYLHLGTQTVSWYADTTADGTTLDKTFTPAVDSDFLWLTGRLHGTNSYDASIGDKTIKVHSKIIVLQGGVELGRAFFPVSEENWSGTPDYTNDANWTDFELFIACDPAIDASGGDVTVRFVSGHKPGSSDYDEYEVKAITYQTAGRTSVRNIARGMLKFCGLATGNYRCSQVTDLSGNTVYLGGNGKIDHGQVRIAASDRPLDFLVRILTLFGFSIFDRRDGDVYAIPIRGTPHHTPIATFTEGVDAFSLGLNADANNLFNAVAVAGASGTGPDGKRFAYAAATASPAPHPLIPNPPGVRTFPVNDQLLTSTGLCTDVLAIQEDLHDDVLTGISWEAEPDALDLGHAVTVTAPTVGFTGDLFLVSLGYDFDENGPNMRCTGWTGSTATITETDDPDPTEVDAQPGSPRPSTEWKRYTPKGSVN